MFGCFFSTTVVVVQLILISNKEVLVQNTAWLWFTDPIFGLSLAISVCSSQGLGRPGSNILYTLKAIGGHYLLWN